MSQINQKIYLGYEDETVSEKYSSDVSFITNKIGGLPDLPPLKDIKYDSRCELCGYLRLLVLQCYAPLQENPYHRTLYIFACIHPGCWNNPKSWSCVRSQYIDESYVPRLSQNKAADGLSGTCKENAKVVSDSWCSGADEWGDEADEKTPAKISDDDDNEVSVTIDRSLKSNNEIEDIEMAIDQLQLSDELSRLDGHVRTVVAPTASAEIEGNFSEITIDTPTVPENNITALYQQVPELPDELKNTENSSIQFVPKFMAVAEEYLSNDDSDMTHHVTHLMQQYAKTNELVKPGKQSKETGGGNIDAEEEYEEAIPLHGDQLFHSFLTRIQINPTQIIRYSLGGQPLLMTALPKNSKPMKCSHCHGDTWFELQILPTIIPSLRLPNSDKTYLEFGTVLIYTCKNSCWKNEDVLLPETVIVQSEPM